MRPAPLLLLELMPLRWLTIASLASDADAVVG